MSKKEKDEIQSTVEAPPNAVVRQVKVIPKIMSCVFNHRIADNGTATEFQWTGQKLNAIWPGVLAFFKWTYDTFHSESQVRLFINQNTGEWKAWAFPQEARTHMTARELSDNHPDYEKTKEQRAMFSDTDGWYYWGTVHHHCSASAFQSGTDSHNEQSQDGIHITVGNLDKNQYTIHFRMYIGGYRLKNVTELTFWDIGNELLTVPEKFRTLLPKDTPLLLARHQMGTPPPSETEFPKEWRENIIDVTPKQMATVSQPVGYVNGSGGSFVGVFGKTYVEKSAPNLQWDLKRAYDDVRQWLHQNRQKPKAVINKMEILVGVLEELDRQLDAEVMDLFAICVTKDVLPANLAIYIEEQEAIEELRQQQLEYASEGGHAPVTVHNAGAPKQQPQQQQQQNETRKYYMPPHWSDR